MAPIRFYSADRKHYLKQVKAIKKIIAQIFIDYNIPYELITYVFCSDSFLLPINQRFLNHDTLTDIITFKLNNKGKPIIGEVYISVDRVRENSFHFKTTYHKEISRVIFHGALHLCGLKDKKKTEREEMSKAEEYYLQKWKSLLKNVSRET